MSHESVLSPFKSGGHNHRTCVQDAVTAAQRICADEGARLTDLRQRVLELVWESHRPVKAYELLNQLQADRGQAAPPTVYRALDFLLEHGLVHRIESLNAFIGCGEPGQAHRGQFLICTGCGTVAEMDDGEITQLLAAKARALGFRFHEGTVEISGACEQCQAQSP